MPEVEYREPLADKKILALAENAATPPRHANIDDPTDAARIEVDLAAYGLKNFCCADDFRSLEIHYRDDDPTNPAQISARLSYVSTIAIYPNRKPEVRDVIIASAGEGSPYFDFIDVGNKTWVSRSFLYPLKRIFGLQENDNVFLSPVNKSTVVQLRSDLPVGSARSVRFVFTACVPFESLHFRFLSSNGSVVVANQNRLVRAHPINTTNGLEITLDLRNVKAILSLPMDDKSLRLSEVIASFGALEDAVKRCRPFKAIQYPPSINANSEPEALPLPFETTKINSSRTVMRIDQVMFAHGITWGHVLSALSITMKPRTVNAHRSIQLMDVRFVNPDEGKAILN